MKQIDFKKAYESRDLEEFLELVFPDTWKPIASRILESGAVMGEEDKFAPKWSCIPFTERKGDEGLETQMKSVIFRVHDCLHQLWGLPVPKDFSEDSFYQFKRAWMCSEISVLTITEFVYTNWLYKTQESIQLKGLLKKRNTLLFLENTELKYKTTKQIASRLDQLLHKKIEPRWIRKSEYGKKFLEDFVPMLAHDRINIDHNWNLLKEYDDVGLSNMPNQRYGSHLDGLELTGWMIDDFYHMMNTDSEIDKSLRDFNVSRREGLNLPEGWNAG